MFNSRATTHWKNFLGLSLELSNERVLFFFPLMLEKFLYECEMFMKYKIKIIVQSHTMNYIARINQVRFVSRFKLTTI